MIKRKINDFVDLAIMVDPTKENWNYIFSEIDQLNKRLEQLGIDELVEADGVRP